MTPPTAPDSWAPDDRRGLLPTNGEASYGTRPLSAIDMVTYHYTAGPASQTAAAVAAYQTSEAARAQTGNGTPFPGLAYTLFVEGSGRAVRAWDLNTRVWHSAASVNGKARNYSSVGVCYAGDHEPNEAQLAALGRIHRWLEHQLGRPLLAEGHGWVYSTSCPGPTSKVWVPKILAAAHGG